VLFRSEELEKISSEARKYGLITVVWSYARGSDLTKDDETAMDVISYAAHMACLVGAHVVKVKLPTNHIKDKSLENTYSGDLNNLTDRVKNITKSCFNGKRLVVFSGGATKNDNELYDEIHSVHNGGGNGSIIGRNSFQRKKEDAIAMLNKIIDIYKK
jgi:class I fructose-bisphosphate aldolase